MFIKYENKNNICIPLKMIQGFICCQGKVIRLHLIIKTTKKVILNSFFFSFLQILIHFNSSNRNDDTVTTTKKN